MQTPRTIKQTAVRFAVCIALTVFLSGCSSADHPAPGSRLTNYAAADAAPTANHTTNHD
ncbi:MAG: hypothetical protein II333_07060 [Clostridia bacterium]|nr:hypothetical protein [Clostridia bacterium]